MSTTQPMEMTPISPMVRTYVLHLELMRNTHSWARRHGDVFDADRFGPTCMTMAAAAPWASVSCLGLVVRQAALLWAVDDELEPMSTPEEFRARLHDFRSAISGDAPAAGTGTTAALAELRTDLSALPLFAELGTRWTDSLVAGISAGFDEWAIARAIANGGPAPTVEDYLRVAVPSILMTPMVLAMLIATERTSLIDHWDRLAPAQHEANVAVRLANDYASYEREKAGRDVNIRMLGVSREQLRQDIDAALARFREHLDPLLGPRPLRAAVTMDRLVHASVEFYLRTDYKSS